MPSSKDKGLAPGALVAGNAVRLQGQAATIEKRIKLIERGTGWTSPLQDEQIALRQLGL